MSPGSTWWVFILAGVAVSLSPKGAEGQQQGSPPSGPPIRASWTSDRIGVQLGTIVTVLIDEFTLAEANRDESAVRERDRDLSLKGGSGSTSAGGTLRTGNNVSRNTQGASARRERFTAELSVRIVELSPGGAARIEGTKRVGIDEHAQEVTVRGWIRTQDLSAENTVESWRIADAEIQYGSNGKLVKAGGIWSKLLDLILP